ncbi:hypothetical protein ACIQU5_25470 [Streptomyces sp. NPDC090306]|uniref:hypothetical protein n=1 Tax=Streptomyces sp. NPDC090306 TaxID=3365961 RepID=UPI0037FF5022
MLTTTVDRDSRLLRWRRVREFAVPPSMIETATARRRNGDWAGACAAAHLDVDLDLRTAARTYGTDFASQVRADLRHLAPDLLRWHMPRIAPDGLLRPGLTVALARYAGPGPRSPVSLVARTPPAWADAGQRISLALWDPSRTEPSALRHPHPHPSRLHRLDLHRHLWDDRRTDELRLRCGADPRAEGGHLAQDPEVAALLPPGCAVDRWAAEAEILVGAGETHGGGSTGSPTVSVPLLPGRHWLLAADRPNADDNSPPGTLTWRVTPEVLGRRRGRVRSGPVPPVLPYAAAWALPDLELLDAGLIDIGLLHPLVASALRPGRPPSTADPRAASGSSRRLIECRGERHRIGVVDGVLVPLDHPPDEVRREELLAALTGTPLPCLQVIDDAHRRPGCLPGVRERLDHGDFTGALAVVEDLLGPAALLRDGALRDELESAAQRRLTHGLFRAGLIGGPPPRTARPRQLPPRPPRRVPTTR